MPFATLPLNELDVCSFLPRFLVPTTMRHHLKSRPEPFHSVQRDTTSGSSTSWKRLGGCKATADPPVEIDSVIDIFVHLFLLVDKLSLLLSSFKQCIATRKFRGLVKAYHTLLDKRQVPSTLREFTNLNCLGGEDSLPNQINLEYGNFAGTPLLQVVNHEMTKENRIWVRSVSNLKFALINYQSIGCYPWRLRWTAHHNIPSRCLDGRLSAENPLSSTIGGATSGRKSGES